MDQLTKTTLFRCTRCGTDRDPSWFSRDRRRRSWRTPWCKPCLREASRLRRTGLTDEAFDALMAGQDGSCAICRTPFDDECLARIDRSVEGLARGLLCGRCKIGLGTFQDDPERLRAASGYLERQTDTPGMTGGPASNTIVSAPVATVIHQSDV